MPDWLAINFRGKGSNVIYGQTMRICGLRIVIPMLHYYPDIPNGASRLAFDEAVFLANLGNEVWTVGADFTCSKPEYAFQDGLHVLRYPGPQFGMFDPRRMHAHQARTRSLLSRHIKNHVDLIHGHSLLQHDGALSFFGRHVRSCYSVHSPVRLEMQAEGRGRPLLKRLQLSVTGHLTHRIERRCLQYSDCITSDSNYTKSLLGRFHDVTVGQRVNVVPGWVDLDRFQIVSDRQAAKSRLGWPMDVPVLFTLRRLVPRMGLDRLLLALQKIKTGGYRFHFIIGGSGPLLTQLEAMVSKLGLLGSVLLIGHVPEDSLPLMYAAADAFVLPTMELECFGLIALESLACGRPVLATPVAAIPEILDRFEPRWLARDATVDAIAHLLMGFLENDLPDHDPEELRENVARYYSRERVLRQLVTTALGLRDTGCASNSHGAFSAKDR